MSRNKDGNIEDVEDHILRRFEFKKRLGRGAYGIVWKAVVKKTGETVAVKKIYDAFRNSIDAQRTYREIMFLQAFRNHPNIIQLHSIHKALNNRDIYLGFEYMDTDLNVIIKKKDILQDCHRRYIMYQLLNGTNYIHSANVIHRDQKPSNVLLDQFCRCKIADFGLARSLDSVSDCGNYSDPPLTEYVATRWYRAPEILVSCKRYTKGIDMWSLGCILGEMISSKPLFPGLSTVNQVERIMMTLPTPTSEDIASFSSGAGIALFKSSRCTRKISLSTLLGKHCTPDALDLIEKLLTINPNQRLTAEQALQHKYVAMYRNPKLESFMTQPVTTPLNDNVRVTTDQYRHELYDIMKSNHNHKNNHVHHQQSKTKHPNKKHKPEVINIKSYSSIHKHILKNLSPRCKQVLMERAIMSLKEKTAQRAKTEEPASKTFSKNCKSDNHMNKSPAGCRHATAGTTKERLNKSSSRICKPHVHVTKNHNNHEGCKQSTETITKDPLNKPSSKGSKPGIPVIKNPVTTIKEPLNKIYPKCNKHDIHEIVNYLNNDPAGYRQSTAATTKEPLNKTTPRPRDSKPDVHAAANHLNKNSVECRQSTAATIKEPLNKTTPRPKDSKPDVHAVAKHSNKNILKTKEPTMATIKEPLNKTTPRPRDNKPDVHAVAKHLNKNPVECRQSTVATIKKSLYKTTPRPRDSNTGVHAIMKHLNNNLECKQSTAMKTKELLNKTSPKGNKPDIRAIANHLNKNPTRCRQSVTATTNEPLRKISPKCKEINTTLDKRFSNKFSPPYKESAAARINDNLNKRRKDSNITATNDLLSNLQRKKSAVVRTNELFNKLTVGRHTDEIVPVFNGKEENSSSCHKEAIKRTSTVNEKNAPKHRDVKTSMVQTSPKIRETKSNEVHFDKKIKSKVSSSSKSAKNIAIPHMTVPQKQPHPINVKHNIVMPQPPSLLHRKLTEGIPGNRRQNTVHELHQQQSTHNKILTDKSTQIKTSNSRGAIRKTNSKI